MVDQKIGRWTLVSLDHKDNRNKEIWNCICECGSVKLVRKDHIVRGASTSCGCYAKENTSRVKTTHGMSSSKTYKIWIEIIARCYNPSSSIYPHYGGRGISMCERWRGSFVNFLADMGERPVKKEIDRIDNNGNYEPTNCRWVSRKENVENRRTSLRYTNNGMTKTLMGWSEHLGIDYKTLFARIKIYKMDIDKALNPRLFK